MYATAKCTRCPREFMTSESATLCPACRRRRDNGRRLAAIRREQRAADYDCRRREYADMYHCPLAEVPAWVGTRQDPIYGGK
jgi:hypothetical protein